MPIRAAAEAVNCPNCWKPQKGTAARCKFCQAPMDGGQAFITKAGMKAWEKAQRDRADLPDLAASADLEAPADAVVDAALAAKPQGTADAILDILLDQDEAKRRAVPVTVTADVVIVPGHAGATLDTALVPPSDPVPVSELAPAETVTVAVEPDPGALVGHAATEEEKAALVDQVHAFLDAQPVPVQEAAGATGVHRATINRWIVAGKLAATDDPERGRLVRVADVLALKPKPTGQAAPADPERDQRPMTAVEAGGVLGLHPSIIRRWVREGKLAPVSEPGASLLVRVADCRSLVTATGVRKDARKGA